MKRLTSFLICALLLVSTSSSGADKWVAARSQNFLLVGNATEGQIFAIANELELFRSAYARIFPTRTSSTQTTIVVFRDDYDLRQHAPIQNGKPISAPAYFQRSEDTNHIVLTGRLADTGVVYHEFVHSLMADYIGELPLCLTEGFAEYYRTFKVLTDGRKFQLGAPIRGHITRLGSQFIPLDKLFAVTRNSPEYNEQDRQGLFYAESWALAHYLIHGDGGRFQARVPELMAALRNGKPPAQAIMDVFEFSITKLEQQLRAYIFKPDAFPSLEFTIPTALDNARGTTARVISEAESEFYRGNLLMNAGRRDDAEVRFRAAIRLDPGLGAPHTALGRLLDLKGDDDAALPLLRRGIELDPTSHMAHYYYASAMWNGSRIPPTPAERELARAEAMKAIDLAPQFVNATALLARINLAGNENLGATLALLRNARQFFPGRDDLTLLAAFVLARTSDRESTPQVLQYVMARTPENSAIHRDAERFFDTFQRDSAARKAGLGPGAADAVLLSGVLTGLECVDGWTLSMSAGGKTQVFKAANPSAVRVITYANNVRPPGCGGVPPAGIPAIVTYRPIRSTEAAGEVLMLELFSRD